MRLTDSPNGLFIMELLHDDYLDDDILIEYQDSKMFVSSPYMLFANNYRPFIRQQSSITDNYKLDKNQTYDTT